MKTNKLSRSLRLSSAATLAICATMTSVSAYAQAVPATDATVSETEDAGEVIIVTGSRIARPDLTASSPVAVIGGDEFVTFNSPSAEELLATNPQFLPEVGAAVNNGNPGVSTLNLRGLGDYRTLVLVNGKRMVAYDSGGVVDVNAIPSSLIQRVDVLTGGASAVYGSDAVAGVVNFILDDEMTGLRFDGSYELTEEGDGATKDLNLTGGFELGDRGNIVASVGYLKRDAVFAGDRDFGEFAISSDDLVSAGGSSTTYPTNFDNTFVDDENDYYQIGPSGDLVPFYEAYNYSPINYLTVPQERWIGTLLAKYEIADGVEFFGRGSYIRTDVTALLAPTGTFGYTFDIYRENPYLTDQQEALFFNGLDPSVESTSVGIRRRIVESGGREQVYENESWQGVTGFRGDLGALSWEVFGQYAETKRDISNNNDITYALVAQALDAVSDGNGGVVCRDTSNGCVPINLFTTDPLSADAVSFISAAGVQSDKTKQWIVGGSLTGDIGAISPWSEDAIGFAIGAEYRKESSESTIDDLYASGELIGYGQGAVFPKFTYDVTEVFGEAIVPLITDRPGFYSLDLELGARYSDYSHIGGVFTWKAGANWEPVEGFRLRGMFNRAIRAPNLQEFSEPLYSGIDNLDTDPCAGSNPVGNQTLTDLCVGTGAPLSQIGKIAQPVSGQINAFYGGNQSLKEETSDTLTLGFVATPASVPGLSLSVDYYDIEIKDALDVLGGSPANVINGCYVVTQDLNNPYCQAIVRNDLTGALSGGIDYGVYQTNFNSAVLTTKGVDIVLGYNRPVGSGDLGFQFAGTYIDTYKKQGATFVDATECAGKFGFACNIAPMPKWKHTASLTYGVGAFSLTGRWRLIGAVEQDVGTDILASELDSYSYFDLSGKAEVSDNFTFRLGVQNLFDKQPPFVGADAGGTGYNQANTFPTVYDPLGRSFFVGVTAGF